MGIARAPALTTAFRSSTTSLHVWLMVLLACAALFSLGTGCLNAMEAIRSQDAPYSGSRWLLQGENPYQVFLDRGKAAFQFSQYPNYLPPIYFAYLPVAALPWELAKLVWLALNLGMTLTLAYLLYRRTQCLWGLLAALFFLSSLPVRAALSNGQPAVLICFCIVMALLMRPSWAKGALLAVAASKYSLGAFFLSWMLGAKRYGVVAMSLLLIVLGYAGIAQFTPSEWGLQLLLGPLQVNQRVLDVYGPFSQLREHLGFGALMAVPVIGLVLAFLLPHSASTRALDLQRVDNQRVLLAVVLICLTLAPHADYDYYLLVIPFIFFNPFRWLNRFDAALLVVALLYFWNVRKLAKFIPSTAMQDAVLTGVWGLMLLLILRLVWEVLSPGLRRTE